MSKKVIAVDADDTLFDENTAIRLYMNEKFGLDHTPEDYNVVAPYEGYWENIWQLDPAEMAARYEAFLASGHKANLEPFPNAIKVLRYLKKDYNLVVLTSRDHRSVEVTYRSLAQHYPDIFQDVHFVPLWGKGERVTKAEICKEIGAGYLIDDGYDHCRLAAESGVTALLYGDYGRNRIQKLLPGMIRAVDWTEVKEYF